MTKDMIGDKEITISEDGFEIAFKGGYVRFNIIETEQLKRELNNA